MPTRVKPTRNADASALPAGLANFDDLPRSAHVRLPVVAALLGASPATIWRWAKVGRIPAPKKLGLGITAWNVGDLRDARAARGGAA